MPPLSSQQVLDLAMEHHRAGRVAEAEVIYRQLLARHPESADLVHLLGVAAHQQGRLDEALAAMERAIALQPGIARYHSNLGLLLADLDRLDESAAALETACQLDPQASEIFYNLGLTRRKLRQWDAAIAASRAALALAPRNLPAWIELGVAHAGAGRRPEAIAVCHEALGHCPGTPALWVNLGGFLKDEGRLDEAAASFREALRFAPGDAVVLNNLATLLKDAGDISGALAALRQSLAAQPHPEVHSNLIFTLSFDPATTPADLRAEQQRWNAQHAAPRRSRRRPHANDPAPERRLRIGYVSADLRNHVVGRTLLPIFEAHDRAQVEVFAYASCPPDAVTARFRAGAAHWRDIGAWTDAQLAARIRETDRIDVLIDLSLHTAHHRLLAFAEKPAPVQVSWLGYPGASGLETMDWRLTDRFLDPPGEEDADEKFERPWRLPHAWCCYAPPQGSPEVSPPPAARNDFITFGSFNNFAKINGRVLERWAAILEAVKDSRLRLLAKPGAHHDRVRAFFAARGLAPERLEMLTHEPFDPQRAAADFLRRYAHLDLALDPFPYNGMTTTGDALWMGVPVIALRGASSLGRASYSLLANLGLADLAAENEDAYVRLAVAFAEDLPRLAALRAGLRARMQASPLVDAPTFARNLEAAWRAMWRRWCAQPSAPFAR